MNNDEKVRDYLSRNYSLTDKGNNSFTATITVNLDDPLFRGTKRERMAQWAELFGMNPDEFIAAHEDKAAT